MPFPALGVVLIREEVPVHSGQGRRPVVGPEGRSALAGQPVRLILPPIPAPDWWACDAELVWKVPTDEVVRLTGRDPGEPVYVCEHMVDVD